VDVLYVHHIEGVIAEEIQRTEVGSLIERQNGGNKRVNIRLTQKSG